MKGYIKIDDVLKIITDVICKEDIPSYNIQRLIINLKSQIKQLADKNHNEGSGKASILKDGSIPSPSNNNVCKKIIWFEEASNDFANTSVIVVYKKVKDNPDYENMQENKLDKNSESTN